jgi:hypothetical protein
MAQGNRTYFTRGLSLTAFIFNLLEDKDTCDMSRNDQFK